MKRLISISSQEDIPIAYQDSPIGLLLEYHNLQRTRDIFDKAVANARQKADQKNSDKP